MLGCLVEKQLTTPQQYPLTLNALVLACNQATNREPTMTLAEDDVQGALDELKAARLVRFVLPSHGKSVTRYRHVLDETYGLDASRVALLAILLLRGPQTPGELRARTERMASFASVPAVIAELDVLTSQPEPLVRLLPRRPGQKEDRWQQLLAAEASAASEAGESSPMPAAYEIPAPESTPADASTFDETGASMGDEKDRADPEESLAALRSELARLRDQVTELATSLEALRTSLGE